MSRWFPNPTRWLAARTKPPVRRKWLGVECLEARDVPSVAVIRHVNTDAIPGVFSRAFTAEGRIGNTVTGGGTFEVDVSDSTAGPFKTGETANHAWTEDAAGQPFTLRFDPVAGLATFTVGGTTVTSAQTFDGLTGDDVLRLRTRAVRAGSEVSLVGLQLSTGVGGPFVDVPDPDGGAGAAATGSTGADDRDTLEVTGAVLRNGFVLTGRTVWAWDGEVKGNKPKQSELAFQIAAGTAPPKVSIVKLQDAYEGEVEGLFRVIRTGPTDAPLDVLYSVSGSATEGEDYRTLSRVVTIPEGESSATIVVSTNDDFETEGDETVTALLSALPEFQVSTTPATLVLHEAAEPVVPSVVISGLSGFSNWPGAFTYDEPAKVAKISGYDPWMARDPNRFLVKVTDSGANVDATKRDEIEVTFSTSNPDPAYNETPRPIRLIETGLNTGQFESAYLIMVSNKTDDEYVPAGGGAENGVDDRTFLGQLGVTVKTVYQSAKHEKTVAPFKTVKLNIGVVTNRVGPGSTPIYSEAEVAALVKNTKEFLAQAGIDVTHTFFTFWPPDGYDPAKNFNPFAEEQKVDDRAVYTEAAIRILETGATVSENDIEVRIIKSFTGDTLGVGLSIDAATHTATGNTILLSLDGAAHAGTLPHEIGHVLTLRHVVDDFKDARDYTPLDKLNNEVNLMAAVSGGPAPGVTGQRRLSDGQITRMLAAKFWKLK